MFLLPRQSRPHLDRRARLERQADTHTLALDRLDQLGDLVCGLHVKREPDTSENKRQKVHQLSGEIEKIVETYTVVSSCV